MTPANRTERFVQELIRTQPRVRAFVRSLVGDPNQTDDILQEVNVVLWRKAGEFEEGTNFAAWACRVAHFQILAHRQKHRRDRLTFDDALVQDLAHAAEKRGDDLDARRTALRDCLEKLSEPQRQLVELRYMHGRSLTDMAQQLGRPDGSIRQTLYRIRGILLGCIRRNLRLETGA